MKKLSRAVEKALNSRGWRYHRHAGGRLYTLPMTIGSLHACRMQVRVGPGVILTMVVFPFDVPAARMAAVSEFAHRFNDIELYGNIDLDLDKGRLRTRSSVIVGEKAPRGDALKLAIEHAPGMMKRIHLALLAIVHHGVDGAGAFHDMMRAEGHGASPSPSGPRPTERIEDSAEEGGQANDEAAPGDDAVDPEWLAEVLRVPPAAPWRPQRSASDVPD